MSALVWIGEPEVVITPTSTTITQDNVADDGRRNWDSIVVELDRRGPAIGLGSEYGTIVPTHWLPLVLEAFSRHTPDPATVEQLLAERDRLDRRARAVEAMMFHIGSERNFATMRYHTRSSVEMVVADEGAVFIDVWRGLFAEAHDLWIAHGSIAYRS